MSEQIKTATTAETTTNNLFDEKWCMPFRILEQKKTKKEKTTTKYYITLGQSIISAKEFKTKLGAELYLLTKPYVLIFNMVCHIIQQFKEDEIIK